MKKFLKTVLAVICGVLLLNLLTIAVIAGMAGSSQGAVPAEGILKIDMSKIIIDEQSRETSPFGASGMQSQDISTIGIWDAVQAVHAAAADPGISYIYLKTDGNQSGISKLYEFRRALEEFRESSGKAVVAYIENPSTASYYLASVADKIYMTPHQGGMSTITGISSQMIFLGDLLKEMGVNVQLIRHGKYKSAGEMFVRNSSSPENREQNLQMVKSLWASISAQTAASRGLDPKALDDAVDNLRLCLPEDFVEAGLVDGLLDRSGLERQLAVLAVAERYEDLTMIPFADYAAAKVLPGKARSKIAVLYASGDIVDGSDEDAVAGDRFASIVEDLRKDNSVKAVVLRVNSPGGSVIASEKIKSELDLLKSEKTLVASYGEYAASGGYWISNNCERIFSAPTTLTGSIGVFSMIPEFSGTASKKLKVGVESVCSNAHGDMFGLMRPFDSAEYQFMQRSVECIYDRFTDIVAEGRGMKKEDVDAIGQGRVWTGADALGINLVDEIGTLEDAVRYAASLAGDPELSHWNVKGYPTPPTLLESLMSSVNGPSDDYSIRHLAKTLTEPRMLARMPYEIRLF